MAYQTREQLRLFFDIETQANPENLALAPEPVVTVPANYKDPAKIEEYIRAETEKRKAELVERAALDPDYGKVLSIGLSYGNTISVWVVGDPFEPDGEPLTEKHLLETFWEHFAICNGYAVGFNILSFDLPFLMARSMYLDVKIPFIPCLAKFRTEPVTDLYAIRYNWGPGKGLKLLAKLLGIPNDCPDVDGSRVASLTPDELRAYQESDVKLVMELYGRMNGVYFCH